MSSIIDHDPEPPKGGGSRQPTAIVITCDLDSESGRSRGFSITEFVELDDGARLLVRDGRGWGSSANTDRNPWQTDTIDSIEADVRFLWDLYLEEEGGLDWMVPILRDHHIPADPQSLEALPVKVELSPVILTKLAEVGADASSVLEHRSDLGNSLD